MEVQLRHIRLGRAAYGQQPFQLPKLLPHRNQPRHHQPGASQHHRLPALATERQQHRPGQGDSQRQWAAEEGQVVQQRRGGCKEDGHHSHLSGDHAKQAHAQM